jgi:hypothetical protein
MVMHPHTKYHWPISKDKNIMARTRKYYLKNNSLTLRSKVKVPKRSLWYTTHRLMVMHPHTKHNWPISNVVQMASLSGDISFRYLKQFFLVIYLLVVCKKNNNSFILVYFNYLSKISSETFLAKFTKNHTRTVKRLVFFVPTQKCMKWLRCCTIVQITSFLMNYTSNAKII